MFLPQRNPIAVSLGPVHIHWYGLFPVAAISGGLWYLLERGRDLQEDSGHLVTVALWAIMAGVVGGRLVFVLERPQWIWHPIQALKIWQGGLAYDGAIGAGILVLWYQLRTHPLVFNHLADWTIPGVRLGIFMVRIGNIFHHEVLGRMTGARVRMLAGTDLGFLYRSLPHRALCADRAEPPRAAGLPVLLRDVLLRAAPGGGAGDHLRQPALPHSLPESALGHRLDYPDVALHAPRHGLHRAHGAADLAPLGHSFGVGCRSHGGGSPGSARGNPRGFDRSYSWWRGHARGRLGSSPRPPAEYPAGTSWDPGLSLAERVSDGGSASGSWPRRPPRPLSPPERSMLTRAEGPGGRVLPRPPAGGCLDTILKTGCS